MDELDSFYTVLNELTGKSVTLDELDYLAKRLDSFDDGEAAQFQGMAHKLGITQIKDFINLTFCCQRATVITDFSDLKEIGQEHYMNLNGGSASMEELENLDGVETALLLIDSGAGTVTPYGVVYDNGMRLEQLYNGRQFPEYLYDNSNLGLKIMPAEGQKPELLWLPASEQQIRRTLLRAGVRDAGTAQYTIQVLPAFIAKQQLDTFATELVREAEIAGRVGSETDRREQALREQTGLDPTVQWSDTGRIQLNEEVSVTLTYEIDLGLFAGFGSFPITLRADATGKSEVYWK